jgi:3-phenylpropionate/cinnamic acid dioxygenase small subunit
VTEREDRQDISDLLVRYATGIDRRDWALFRTVFTDDCELDYGEIGVWNGADAVTDFMEEVHAMAGHTMHRLSNQEITVDGDKAATTNPASTRSVSTTTRSSAPTPVGASHAVDTPRCA